MNADEIRAFLKRQIGERGAETNYHGISVAESLVDPVKVLMTYPRAKDAESRQNDALVWLLLEERPDSSGYKIIYDEDNGLFGLATGGHDGSPVIVSSYSRFMDAFAGM